MPHRDNNEVGALGAISLDHIDDREINPREFVKHVESRYLGRVEFGDGTIDATEFPEQEYKDHLDYIASDCLIYSPRMTQKYGGCMDGRGNNLTLNNQPVLPRPKVIGGPSLYGWYLASVGDFAILKGVDDPIEQFIIVNRLLHESGFGLGMHVECGAARGIQPVLKHYSDQYNDVNNLVGEDAKELIVADLYDMERQIKRGIERTGNLAAGTPGFDEQTMHKIIMEITGDRNTVVTLNTDLSHPNHGHEEVGLMFMRVKNAIVAKDKAIKEKGVQLFQHNTVYADNIAQVLITNEAEALRAKVIGDQLPLAGVATLGKGQHVGEISGLLMPR